MTWGGTVSLNYETNNFGSNKISGPFAKISAGAQASSLAHSESVLTPEAQPRPPCGPLQCHWATGCPLFPLISLQNLGTFLLPNNTQTQVKAFTEQVYPFNFTPLILIKMNCTWENGARRHLNHAMAVKWCSICTWVRKSWELELSTKLFLLTVNESNTL